MAGFIPAIHVFVARSVEDVDARDKPGRATDRSYSAGLAAGGAPAAARADVAFFSTMRTAMIEPS